MSVREGRAFGARTAPLTTGAKVTGLMLEALTHHQAVALVRQAATQPAPRATLLFHVNCHSLYHFDADPELRAAVQAEARLVLEGVALQAAVRLTGGGLVPQVNGSDLFPLAMQALAGSGTRLFLLGGEPGVAAMAAAAIRQRWPTIRIVGTEPGFPVPDERSGIADRIAAARPDIVLLGLGTPIQERMALSLVDNGAPLVWTVGGLFDLLAGRKPRAPAWLRALSLEWAFRLAREPKRLWRRTLIEAPWLARRILADCAARRGTAE